MKGKTNFAGLGIGVGAALGAAVGAATGNMGVWLGIGVAVGVALGGWTSRNRSACGDCGAMDSPDHAGVDRRNPR
jgi:hypothetical protein